MNDHLGDPGRPMGRGVRLQGAFSDSLSFYATAIRHNLLVALPRFWPFLVIPNLRPRRTVAIGGDNGGGIFTQDEGDLARRPDASHRAPTSDRHVAQSPCRC
jgi:hypothetical protein